MTSTWGVSELAGQIGPSLHRRGGMRHSAVIAAEICMCRWSVDSVCRPAAADLHRNRVRALRRRLVINAV